MLIDYINLIIYRGFEVACYWIYDIFMYVHCMPSKFWMLFWFSRYNTTCLVVSLLTTCRTGRSIISNCTVLNTQEKIISVCVYVCTRLVVKHLIVSVYNMQLSGGWTLAHARCIRSLTWANTPQWAAYNIGTNLITD